MANGMDLVDGDMNVKVVRVVMNHADTLMLFVSQASTYTILDGFKDFRGWGLSGSEGNQEVVGFIGFGPGVLGLCSLRFHGGPMGIVGMTVRYGDFSHALRFALPVNEIVDQAGKVALFDALDRDSFRDHGHSAEVFRSFSPSQAACLEFP
jgi:hypothetical protein